MPTVTALEEVPGDAKRRHVIFADAPTVELSLEIALEAGLLPGRTVPPSVIEQACWKDALKRTENDALSFLSRKDLSETELRRRLLSRGHAEEYVEAIIEKCRQWGYVDDRRLAEQLVADGVALKHLGPARLRQKLRERGIGEELAEEVLRTFENRQPPLVEQAVSALRGKMRAYARLVPEVARRRMIAYLQRRGFDFDTIREALRRIGEDIEG